MEPCDFILRQLEVGPMMNFVYLIGCPDSREAAVVDPAWDVRAILQSAEELDLKIRHILITHGHPDHVNGLEPLLKATDARVYLHADEADYMGEMARDFGLNAEFISHRLKDFQMVAEGDIAQVGGISIQFLHTPGHTPGSQCFLTRGCLISGDTLFVDACGRVDMPGGDPAKMWWSLNHKLRAIENSTILYPGHDYGGSPTATMGEQKQNNPYMKYDSVRQFVRDMGL
jgi:hydroxyacylglutathione hydrolase